MENINYTTKEDVLAIEVKMAEMEPWLVRKITAQERYSGSHLWYQSKQKDIELGWVYGGIEGQTGNLGDGVTY